MSNIDLHLNVSVWNASMGDGLQLRKHVLSKLGFHPCPDVYRVVLILRDVGHAPDGIMADLLEGLQDS